MEKALRVGVYSDSYPDKRMILNKIPDCAYVQVKHNRELYARALRFVGKKCNGLTQSDRYAQGVHFTLDTDNHPDLDVIHTFNRVCLRDNNDWVATFERTFPEYFSEESKIDYAVMRKQLPLILSGRCKAILPMSNWAYEYELRLLRSFASSKDIQTIKNKMTILYPPQEILASAEEIREKYTDLECIRFFYVGSQMKRKGGLEVLRSFYKLRKEYDNFSVVVVGDPERSYNNFYVTEQEAAEIDQMIESADWLQFHKQLSNDEVLTCARKAHVGLLPSMGDTFGFSVLEMQASGCPVITTDREALPEINNSDCGWVLDTGSAKLSHGDDFAYYSRAEIQKLSEMIQMSLTEAIRTILENPGTIEKKAVQAINRIQSVHSPEQYASKLLDIYRRPTK